MGLTRTALAPILAASTLLATAVPAGAATLDHARVLATWHASALGEGFGWAVADLGDQDGDGRRDAAIAAPRYAAAGSATDGRVYVESSGQGQLRVLHGSFPGEAFGFAVSGVGDLTGDGVSDLLVGATGILTTGACPTDVANPGHVYLFDGATGRLVRRSAGEHAGDMFGYSVGPAGDLDGDGVPDVVTSAACSDTAAGLDAGRAYVLSGRTLRPITSYDGAAAGAAFGSAVTSPGDLDGDGVGDVVVGAKDDGPATRGRVYAFSTRTHSRLWSYQGDAQTVDVGWFFVSGVPDINGDGVADIYVSDFDAGRDPINPAGRVILLSGRTGERIYSLRGNSPNEGVGPGRSLGGDADGDGVDDLVVGRYTSSRAGSFAGAVSVVSGRTGEILRTIAATIPGGLLGFDTVGLGDVSGDGRPDFIVSAERIDTVYLVAGA